MLTPEEACGEALLLLLELANDPLEADEEPCPDPPPPTAAPLACA
jgi:hypothetical protein